MFFERILGFFLCFSRILGSSCVFPTFSGVFVGFSYDVFLFALGLNWLCKLLVEALDEKT